VREAETLTVSAMPCNVFSVGSMGYAKELLPEQECGVTVLVCAGKK
jgi:hypothetical protein